ncbi:MAG TPA: EutN/CcmL family microcompartment protein [Brevefilum sp.]
MIIGKVVGTVVTTISHPHYRKRRLLVVQPMVSQDDQDDPDFIAVDHAHAGVGDTVLVNRDGNGARQVLDLPGGSIISVIVGIVDSVKIDI